jgi:peptide-methionine (S)-S-oxide reductase
MPPKAKAAEMSAAAAAQDLGRPRSAIKVELRGSAPFWPAEQYHQNYAELNDLKYSFYRFSCGRDRRLDAVWGAQARTGQSWQKATELE